MKPCAPRFVDSLCGLAILTLLAAPIQAASQESSNLPDSPGASHAVIAHRKVDFQSDAARDPESQPVLISQAQAAPPTTQSAQAPAPQKPVGTAAAEAPNVTAIAASQPAGAAIAPAKQRRVRTIILKTGAIIGAGVAVGVIVALTAGTSSKPPGAH